MFMIRKANFLALSRNCPCFSKLIDAPNPITAITRDRGDHGDLKTIIPCVYSLQIGWPAQIVLSTPVSAGSLEYARVAVQEQRSLVPD